MRLFVGVTLFITFKVANKLDQTILLFLLTNIVSLEKEPTTTTTIIQSKLLKIFDSFDWLTKRGL